MGDGAQLGEAFKSKQGKVVIVGGVAFVGYMYWRNKQVAASAIPATDTGTTVPGTDSLGMPTVSGPGGGSAFGASSGGSSTTEPGAPANTNASWVQNAVSQLVGLGRDGSTVADALGAWIAGQPLTSAQQQIVQTAVGLGGSPPVPVPPVTTINSSSPGGATTTTTSAAPSAGHRYTSTTLDTIKVGETEAGIAKEFGIGVADLKATNPSKHLTHLTPGEKIYVPKKKV